MKKLFFSLMFFSLLLSNVQAFAKTERIIFWYPGEAGSQTEAQPLLDAFSKLMAEQTGNMLEAVYVNNKLGGEKYITSKKPLFGILSYPTWFAWKRIHPESTVFLQVVPTHGKLMEQYLLVGKDAPNGTLNIFSSEPLEINFVREQLFPQKNWLIKITPQAQLFFKLKELAEGKWNGFCLLTPREAKSFLALKSSWKENLKFTHASQNIPTPRLVLFGQNKTGNIEVWRNAFLNLASQPNAAETLEELSLRGFAK